MMRNAKRLAPAGIALTFIIAGFWFVPTAESASVTLLVEDFSGLDAYTRDQQGNPYWLQAGNPLWLDPADPYWSVQPLGSIAFQTNNLGYYTSGFNDGQGVSNFVDYHVDSGFMRFTWNQRPYQVYWYSALALGNQPGLDLTPYKYLRLRVRGNVGGETFRVKIDTDGGTYPPQREVSISNYVALPPDNDLSSDWRTVLIPLTAFNLTNQHARAVVFLFDAPRPGHSTETVSVDEILFDSDPAYRAPSDGVVKPATTHTVKVAAKQMTVGGVNYQIRGVGYSPVAIGQTPDFGTYQPFTQAVAQRDFPLLQAMGVNTVRTWARFDYEQFDQGGGLMNRTYTNRAMMQYGAEPYGIKVCAGFWIPYEISFANEWAKARIKENFTQFVTSRKAEPQLLMWVIGNENNVQNGYDWRWYQFANDLAKTAYNLEKPAYHPVAIVEADLGTLGVIDLGSDNAHLNYVDVIGVNAYRGKDWETFFTEATAKTAKAIWISEFGIDAWNSFSLTNPSQGQVDQALQADYALKAWLEFYRNRATNIGATIQEYSDEWWKYRKWPSDQMGSKLFSHDYLGFNFSGINPAALPDGYMNEEWWGLMEVQQDAPGLDRVIPRQAQRQLYSMTIGGRVRNEANQPVANAAIEVWLAPANAVKLSDVTTDAYGFYAVPELPAGTYTVRLLKPGAAPVNASASVSGTARTAIADFTYAAKVMLTALSATPAVVLPGGTLSVANTVKNQGTTVATNVAVTFVFSRNSLGGGSDDIPLAGSRTVPSLGAGLLSAATTPVIVPAGTPFGSYYLCGKVTASEADSGNSTRCVATKFTVAGADLAVTQVTTTATTVKAGLTVAVTDTVKNQGGTTSAASTVKYSLSLNQAFGDGDDVAVVTTRAVPALLANGVSTVAVAVAIPTLTPPARYFVCSMADPSNGIIETDEANNGRCSNTTFQVTNQDLVVEAIKFYRYGSAETPADEVTIPSVGQPVTVKAILRNTGNVGTGFFGISWSLDTTGPFIGGHLDLPAGAVSNDNVRYGGSNGWTTVAGVHTFKFIADFDNQIVETLETNNQLSRVVTPVAASDLTVTAVSTVSTAAAPGMVITLSNTVKNLSGGPAYNDQVAFHLSRDAVYGGADDVVFAATRTIASLGATLSNAVASPLTIPAGTPAGSYYLCAFVDAIGVSQETNEANNTRCTASPLNVVLADLTVGQLSVPTATVKFGVATNVGVTRNVKNLQSVSVGASTLGYELSLDPNYGGGDSRPVSPATEAIPALAPNGATAVGALVLTIPAATPEGSYVICARADVNNQVPNELSETNNDLCTLNRINVTGKDAVVSAIKFYRNGWPETVENEVIPVAGEVVTAKAIVTNAGTTQIPGFNIDWKLDNGTVYAGSNGPLQPAQVSEDNVRFNWAATAGAHTLKFTADGNNTMPEFNELNNTFSRTVTVLQPSDLTVTAFTTNLTSVARGGAITVTDTTRNVAAAGSATALNFRVAYYLSTDTNVTPGDPLLPNVRSIAALAPGGASALAVAETIPTSVAPGTYYVCAQVDPKVTVFEANEGNNVRCTAAPITVQ